MKGVVTMTQSEEFFDCYPAIKAAFKHTKLYSKEGEDIDDEEEESKEEETPKAKTDLEFDELKLFFWFLRQYFLLCQVCVNLVMDYYSIITAISILMVNHDIFCNFLRSLFLVFSCNKQVKKLCCHSVRLFVRPFPFICFKKNLRKNLGNIPN